MSRKEEFNKPTLKEHLKNIQTEKFKVMVQRRVEMNQVFEKYAEVLQAITIRETYLKGQIDGISSPESEK